MTEADIQSMNSSHSCSWLSSCTRTSKPSSSTALRLLQERPILRRQPPPELPPLEQVRFRRLGRKSHEGKTSRKQFAGGSRLVPRKRYLQKWRRSWLPPQLLDGRKLRPAQVRVATRQLDLQAVDNVFSMRPILSSTRGRHRLKSVERPGGRPAERMQTRVKQEQSRPPTEPRRLVQERLMISLPISESDTCR